MSKKNTSDKGSKAANVATQTIDAETAPVAAQEPQIITETEPAETAPAEFEHCDLFPILTEGAKFEINGYKVTVTKKEYLKDEKFPYTAWDAEVTTPDGTEKEFSKVRNTAIRNYCHATSGITHAGGSQAITKVLTDEELGTECTRRAAQIKGLLDRAAELYTKYTGGQLIEPGETFTADHRAAILDTLKTENEARKESALKAKAANAIREQRKETRDLTKEISDLIAAGNFQKAAELMQMKAEAQKATTATEPETTTDNNQ